MLNAVKAENAKKARENARAFRWPVESRVRSLGTVTMCPRVCCPT